MSKEKILTGIDEQIQNKKYDIADTALDPHISEEWKSHVTERQRRQLARLQEIRVELVDLLGGVLI